MPETTSALPRPNTRDISLHFDSIATTLLDVCRTGGRPALCAWMWVVFVTLLRTTGTRPLGFLFCFVSFENPPLTMVNLMLAAGVRSMTFGFDVAFYAALIGVPIVLLTLTVVERDPRELAPEDIVSATIEDPHPVKI